MKRRDFIARALSGLAAVTGLAIAAAPALLASRSPSFPPGSPYPNNPYPPDPESVALAAGQPAKEIASAKEVERAIALPFEQENTPGVYDDNFVFDEVQEYHKYWDAPILTGDTDPHRQWENANVTINSTADAFSGVTTAANGATQTMSNFTLLLHNYNIVNA